MANYTVITVDNNDGIYTVTLNRPEKRNAMNPQLHREMHGLLSELRFDPQVRVLIITGAGESFCAGQDLKEYLYALEKAPQAERERIRILANEWRSHLLRLFHAPTIAAINGYCFGGAFSIVCSCDIAIAANEATFGLSEINFKHFPSGLVTKDIVDMLRPREGLYYALTGEPFNGERAAQIGLVNKALPRVDLMAEVQRLAHVLKEKDPVALRAAKTVFKVGRNMNYEEAYEFSKAKTSETTLLQKGEWLESGIGEFMKGTYRPGLGTAT